MEVPNLYSLSDLKEVSASLLKNTECINILTEYELISKIIALDNEPNLKKCFYLQDLNLIMKQLELSLVSHLSEQNILSYLDLIG